MKATKIAVLPVILLVVSDAGGCVTIGQKSTTINGLQTKSLYTIKRCTYLHLLLWLKGYADKENPDA